MNLLEYFINEDISVDGKFILTEKKKSDFQKLKDNKVNLTPEERKECKDKKAEWSGGYCAVWKSVDPKTNKVTYVTNTHRAYQARPTLKGAISIFHSFIKSTA